MGQIHKPGKFNDKQKKVTVFDCNLQSYHYSIKHHLVNPIHAEDGLSGVLLCIFCNMKTNCNMFASTKGVMLHMKTKHPVQYAFWEDDVKEIYFNNLRNLSAIEESILRSMEENECGKVGS